jgi:hypothetical protein
MAPYGTYGNEYDRRFLSLKPAHRAHVCLFTQHPLEQMDLHIVRRDKQHKGSIVSMRVEDAQDSPHFSGSSPYGRLSGMACSTSPVAMTRRSRAVVSVAVRRQHRRGGCQQGAC